MPTQHDFYEALLEGRWQPEISMGQKGDKNETLFYAEYNQGDGTVVERTSKWSVTQAEGDLMEELREGALRGDYFPLQN